MDWRLYGLVIRRIQREQLRNWMSEIGEHGSLLSNLVSLISRMDIP